MKSTWCNTLRLLPLFLGVTATAQANVLITEYVEGGGNNKAVEISNLSDSDVDLSGYKLSQYANGEETPKATYAYSGMLGANKSLVIYNSSAEDPFKNSENAIPEVTIVQHNGNDVFTLTKDDAIVDSIGQIKNSDNFAKDVTLRRKESVTSGHLDNTDVWASDEWASFPKDTADGLGCPGENACVADPNAPSGPNLIISEIINGTDNNKVIEISNTGDQDVDLATDYHQLQLFHDGADWPSEQVWLTGTLKAGSSIVIYDADAGDNFKKDAPQGLDGKDVTTFDGNDAIVLKKGLGLGTVVDSFGKVGSNEKLYTEDAYTIRRKANDADTTETDDFDKAAWSDVLLADTFDGLGCSGEAACAGGETLPEAGTAVQMGVCLNCTELEKYTELSSYNHDAYYTTVLAADSSDKTSFRTALSQDISANVKKLTYGETWRALTYTDVDSADSDNVVLIYSGRSIFKTQNGSGDQANVNQYWNREHIWPKGKGFSDDTKPGHNDIHHLRPAQVSINNDRASLDFATNDSSADDYGNKKASDSWEPRAAVKGDVARMAFYMDVRYETGDADGMPDLKLVNSAGDTDFTDGDAESKLGKLCDLIAWHIADPVDTFETNRNNTAYEYQGNRNPFIDHPEWAYVVFKDECPKADITSDNFKTEDSVELSTQITSEAITLAGFEGPQPVSITNGEYSIGCTDSFVSDLRMINADTQICVRHTSSDQFETQTITTLTVGNTNITFTSMTKLDPSLLLEIDPIAFVTQENIDRLVEVKSETQTLTGFDREQPITVRNGEYSIGCGDTFTSERGAVNPNDTLCLRHTASAEYAGEVVTEVSIGASTFTFKSVTKADPNPVEEIDAIVFTSQNDVELNAVLTTEVVDLTGFTAAQDITIENGEYSKNCDGTFVSTAGTVAPNDKLCLRHTSAATYDTETTTKVTIGASPSFTFTSKTKVNPVQTIDPITFATQTDVERFAAITSETVTLSGFTLPQNISIEVGEYSIGCTDTFVSEAATVSPGDQICLRHTASTSYSKAVTSTLTIGASTVSFTSVTKADPSPNSQTPNSFGFSPAYNTNRSLYVTSGIIVVGGIQGSVAIEISGSENSQSEYSIGCGSSFKSEAGTVSNGDLVCVRHMASAVNDAETKTTLTIGGVSADFVSRTKSARTETEESKARTISDDDDEETAIGSFGNALLFALGLLTLLRRRAS